MTTIHRTYLIIFMCLLSFWVQAQTQYVFQSESPIANYAWDENDTSRYEGHYRFENVYLQYIKHTDWAN